MKWHNAEAKSGQTKKVDPVLKLYVGVPVMTTTNLYIKEVRGNGTKYSSLKIKMKQNYVVNCKN